METTVTNILVWCAFLVLQSLLGYLIVRKSPNQYLVWLFPLISILIAHSLFLSAPPLLRMITLIIPLLHAMKIVVANAHTSKIRHFDKWLVYYFLTVNMNPSIFHKDVEKRVDTKILISAVVHLLVGVSIFIFLRYFTDHSIITRSKGLQWSYSLLALFSLSLILHFGLLSLNTFFLRRIGIADYLIFKQPYKSKSLTVFWGRRWNLAFSEMTATAVFKPLARKFGVKWASFISFMVSGLLHEVAISLSVLKGFGLPMLYFVIHGLLMELERHLFTKRQPGTIWVIASLIIPLPLLFHTPFLTEVVWELIYLGLP
ncbi:MAG: MBOAT family protein [Thermonemataceae bacterium]